MQKNHQPETEAEFHRLAVELLPKRSSFFFIRNAAAANLPFRWPAEADVFAFLLFYRLYLFGPFCLLRRKRLVFQRISDFVDGFDNVFAEFFPQMVNVHFYGIAGNVFIP